MCLHYCSLLTLDSGLTSVPVLPPGSLASHQAAPHYTLSCLSLQVPRFWQ